VGTLLIKVAFAAKSSQQSIKVVAGVLPWLGRKNSRTVRNVVQPQI